MKNKKPIIIVLTLLIIVSLIGGFLGLFQSLENKKKSPEPETPGNYNITYEYYVEEVQQDDLPLNEEDNILYMYDKATCTNKVEGEWDEEEWKYVVEPSADATCRLYFLRANYEVTVNVTNGAADENNPQFYERLTSAYLKLVPEAGYEYESVTCSGEKEAIWDAENSELVINSVDADTTCNVKMKLKTLTLEIKVSNGTGAGKETGEYGSSVTAIVTPKDGYEKGSIKCTNNQLGDWTTDNKLTIDKITNNTVCTVTFNKKETTPTNVVVRLVQTNLTIVSGSAEQQVSKGATVVWVFRVSNGFTYNGISCTNAVSANAVDDGTNVTVTLTATKATVCTPDITQD